MTRKEVVANALDYVVNNTESMAETLAVTAKMARMTIEAAGRTFLGGDDLEKYYDDVDAFLNTFADMVCKECGDDTLKLFAFLTALAAAVETATEGIADQNSSERGL